MIVLKYTLVKKNLKKNTNAIFLKINERICILLFNLYFTKFMILTPLWFSSGASYWLTPIPQDQILLKAS